MSKCKKEECTKFIEETRLDDNRRAKDTLEYEQMLMNFIESQFTNSGEFND